MIKYHVDTKSIKRKVNVINDELAMLEEYGFMNCDELVANQVTLHGQKALAKIMEAIEELSQINVYISEAIDKELKK